MGDSKKIKDYINELKVIKHHINPQELEVGKEYHVPPFISIKRMDIVITSKADGIIKFKITSGSTEKDEKTMEYSSILSRFLVKKMEF
jgi:hypothetical protein